MANENDRMDGRMTTVFQTNLKKQFDGTDNNKSFGKMNANKVDDGDVPVIKFSGDNFDDNSDSSDGDSDVISKYIGHYGWWQFFWTILLGLCQCPSTFQIYAFVFQVNLLFYFIFI